jgi:SAM-dependent methyltransferase
MGFRRLPKTPLLTIPFTDWELLYGFNAPETGFVWSNFAFGIRFGPGDANIALLAMYPHDEGVLHVHNSAGGSKDYPLARGDNLIFLHAPLNAPRFDFSVSPQRAMPEEVRELGVLLRVAHRAATRAELDAAGPVIDGVKGDWMPAQRLQAGKLLTRCLLESYVGPGVFMSYIDQRGKTPVLEVAVFLPSWAPPAASRVIKVAINEDVVDVHVQQQSNEDGRFCLAHLPETALRGLVDLKAYASSKGVLKSLDIRWVEEEGADLRAGQSMHWRGDGHGKLPAEKNMFRVAGAVSVSFFLGSGASWFVKMTRYYEELAGRPFAQCGNVLDWGVGCGRIARFFEKTGPRLYGVDIDAVNIGWCKKHLPWIETVQTSTNPPLPFADGMFELVYGHSVMTHLSEPDQMAWLAELARVTRPGGYCLLTVLNELSWFIRYFPDGRSADQLEAFISAGIMDDGSLNVGVDADRPGAYRNMSHSSAYIFRVWAEYFEVVRIVHGFADLQSLVVLRRRG